MKKVWKSLTDQKGFGMIEYLAISVIAIPFSLVIADFAIWGTGWMLANSIVNDTAQYAGEHGGADDATVDYMRERFANAWLDPSDWDLTLTRGPLQKGDQGIVAVQTTYTFRTLQPLGLDFTLNVPASATYTSNTFLRP